MAAHRPAARAIGSDGPPPPAPAVGDVSRSVRLPKGRVFVVPRGAEGGYGDRSTTVAEAVAAAASGAPDGGECMTVARAGGGGGGGGGGATAVRLVGPAATGAPTARWPAAANRQTAVSGSLGHGTRVTKVPSITSAAAAAIHAMARIASTRSVSMHGGVCGGGGGEGGAGTDGTGGAGGAGASPTPVTDGPSGGGTTDGGGSGTPEESSDTDDSECFPAAATVQLEGGGVTTMDRLSVGDRVRTASGSYSDVFLFTHAEATGDHTYIRLSTAAGALTATRGHYVLVNGGVRTAAAAVVVGDVLSHLPAGVCGGRRRRSLRAWRPSRGRACSTRKPSTARLSLTALQRPPTRRPWSPCWRRRRWRRCAPPTRGSGGRRGGCPGGGPGPSWRRCQRGRLSPPKAAVAGLGDPRRGGLVVRGEQSGL
eukprot:TRINITY_DN759_c0_g1_i4.p1 TRINITY_DN759_c0_g1~~TRINITY_DN759_c0_g1_i4.p1  ORF type:complete len:477 (+),score=104.91 TRINITY_DN759_c0_g1_i4:159-1433(+)